MKSLLVSIIWIYSLTGFGVLLFKKRFEIVLPFSLIFGTLMLYFGGFIKHISYMYYCSYIFVLLFFIYLIYLFIKKRKEQLIEFKNSFVTTGSILFLVIIIYFFFLHSERQLLFWDEYQHWGIMPAEMLRLDGFYSQTPSRLYLHKDYPPFFSIVEMLWCYFNGGTYTEPDLYRALSIFSLALYIPVFKNLNIRKVKDWIKGIITLLIIVLANITISINLINENIYFYNSIIIDWQMALLAAYCMYLAFSFKEFDWFNIINLSISMMALVLTKQMGTPLCMLVMLLLFIKVIINRKQITKKQLLIYILFFIVLPILSYLSWSFIKHVYTVDIYSQFKISDISLSTLIDIVNGIGGSVKEVTAFNNFITKLLNGNLCRFPFEVSYFPYVIMIFILLFVIIYFFKKSLSESLSISLVYLFGSVAYAFAMLLTYVFMFGEIEGPGLSSFDRYMFSYLFMGFTLLVIIMSDLINSKDSVLYNVGLLVFVLLFVNYEDIYNLNLNKEYKKDISTDYALIKEYNKKHFISGDSILVIDQWNKLDERNNENNVLKYTYIVNNNQVDKIQLNDISKITLDDYIELLKNHVYLYTYAVDDYYINNYWQQTTEDWLLNERLYKIEQFDNNIKYQLVENNFNLLEN